MPTHTFIFMPCREPWPATSVDARLPPVPVLQERQAEAHQRQAGHDPREQVARADQAVEQMTWAPGFPTLVSDRLVVDTGWFDRAEVTCLNLYRPPRIKLGNAAEASPWISHVHTVYPDEADHVITWLAHRVQRPQEKINHALVLGGAQGIRKDTLLEPLKPAIGPWNFHSVSPTQLLGRFNPFAKSVVLQVSEARDLGDVDRFKFYDHTKDYGAAPPNTLYVDEKFIRGHYVFNVVGFIITTNHKDGI